MRFISMSVNVVVVRVVEIFNDCYVFRIRAPFSLCNLETCQLSRVIILKRPHCI